MTICTDKVVSTFLSGLGVYLDTTETCDDYNYISGGFEEPESDLSMLSSKEWHFEHAGQ